MSNAHAFLAPSAAARWVACPGSASLESRYPEQGDAAASAEGTAAHWVVQQMFDGWAPERLLEDGKTEAGHPVTREMIEGAQLLVGDVRDTLAPYAVSVPIVEQPVAIPRVHPALCWGTPDVTSWGSFIAAADLNLFLWDYKFGHKHVEAFENWQLVCYAAGRLSDFQEARKASGLEPWPEDRIMVVMRVVQPRSYHRDGPIREWRMRASDLAPYVFRLSMAADEATGENPECRPQPDACENCTARHACEALQRAAYRGMDLARQAQALELTPAALGLELRYLRDAAKLMEARETGLAAQVESLIRQGVAVPHWKLAPGGSRRKWNKSDIEVIVMGEMLGFDLAKPPEAITPTQAKAAGVMPSLLAAYSFEPPGAAKLTVDDGTDARRVFANPT